MSGFAFEAFGLSIGVRCNDDAALAHARAMLGGLAAREQPGEVVEHLFSLYVGPPSQRRGVRNAHFVFSGPSQFVKTADRDEAFRVLRSTVETLVSRHSPTHTGLLGALVEVAGTGWLICADDASAVSDLAARWGGVVRSEALALAGRDGSLRAGPEVAAPLPGRGVLFVHGASPPRGPIVMSPGQTALGLMGLAPALRDDPSRVLPILRAFSLCCPALHVDAAVPFDRLVAAVS